MGYFETYLASEQRQAMSYERWMEAHLDDLDRQLAESRERERKMIEVAGMWKRRAFMGTDEPPAQASAEEKPE